MLTNFSLFLKSTYWFKLYVVKTRKINDNFRRCMYSIEPGGENIIETDPGLSFYLFQSITFVCNKTHFISIVEDIKSANRGEENSGIPLTATL